MQLDVALIPMGKDLLESKVLDGSQILITKKRHEELDLVCRYSPEEYPTYENYDAIEVSKTVDIPYDYSGAMGVPITFLDKYNPEQFEIIGQSLECADMNIIKSKLGKLNGGPRFYIRCENSLKRMYERIIIRNKHPRL